METKFTKGKWKINHWEKSDDSGVSCIKTDNNISYFSGDAINQQQYHIVSNISFKEHDIEASFEGAHIADINDRGRESMANAKLIAAAPNTIEKLHSSNEILKALLALFGSDMALSTRFGVSHQISENEQAIKDATE